ncbi:hypothetical protein VYU27_008243 [Nannochloropsis oceanica]
MKNTRRDFFAVLGRRFHEEGKKVKFWFHIRNLVEHETYSSGLLWALSTNSPGKGLAVVLVDIHSSGTPYGRDVARGLRKPGYHSIFEIHAELTDDVMLMLDPCNHAGVPQTRLPKTRPLKGNGLSTARQI